MKKTAFYSLIVALLSLTSCEMFEIDNYEEPAETIQGVVVDAATGKPILTDQGSEGIRVRMTELSWGDNVQHNPDFYCMSDGSFQNTKIFKGEYNIRVDGPFMPIVRETKDGVPLIDESQTLWIEGTAQVKFEVQPFLHVEIVGDPMVSNGRITAQVRVTRGVSKEEFKEKIQPTLEDKYKDEFVDMTDIQLFVSYSSSVGYRARDERWSSKLEYAGAAFEASMGKPVTIKTNGSIPAGRKVYIRAAARINYDTPAGSGTRRWNYSAPMEVLIP